MSPPTFAFGCKCSVQNPVADKVPERAIGSLIMSLVMVVMRVMRMKVSIVINLIMLTMMVMMLKC